MVADRGYYKGLEILACEQAGITNFVPKPLTSGSKAEGRFGKQDFIYVAASDEEYEGVIDAMQARLEHDPAMMRVRRQTVEHPFGTLKYWMGSTHFLTKTLLRVSTEMSLHVLAYNLNE
ncbi:transposase family protein [Pseudomonas sp. GM21]|nr:transposase family protein [Pseudomonas sp. GM21]